MSAADSSGATGISSDVDMTDVVKDPLAGSGKESLRVGQKKNPSPVAKTRPIREERTPLPVGEESNLDDRSAYHIVEKNKRVANRQHFRMGWILSAGIALLGLLGLAGVIWKTDHVPFSLNAVFAPSDVAPSANANQ